MQFHKGSNVVVGANNSGKTGLLTAIKLLYELPICAVDFNKVSLKLKGVFYIDSLSSMGERSIFS